MSIPYHIVKQVAEMRENVIEEFLKDQMLKFNISREDLKNKTVLLYTHNPRNSIDNEILILMKDNEIIARLEIKNFERLLIEAGYYETNL